MASVGKRGITRGLRRGHDTGLSCLCCKWDATTRRRLIERHLDGLGAPKLALEFPASKSGIGNHLAHCVAREIAQARAHRMRALDWTTMLAELESSSTDAASAIRDAAERRDAAAAIMGIDKLTDTIDRRVKLAKCVTKAEHTEMALIVREMAHAMIDLSPAHAPEIIAAILKDQPSGKNVLEEISEGDRDA